MTIWFSTNIPEMRAISSFNRASTDISEIQQRFATGQRINSGRDDPGGLIVREGLRADIKGIHGLQAGMGQAENLTNVAAGGMMKLLELIAGSDPSNPSEASLLGALNGEGDAAAKKVIATNFMTLYDSIVASTTYSGDKLLATTDGLAKTYQLGGGQSLAFTLPDLQSSVSASAAAGLKTAIEAIANDTTLAAAVTAAETLQTAIATHVGTLGGSQNVIALNQRALDSRLESFVGAEGRISNVDLAWESSRMARAELLAQNSMNSILYNRNYAAFAVRSLFG
ncbi:MAG: hypothetical protein FWG73_00650 [Planctomycetaceae bacterium]|nr:hypothetical protein [Planctomycetaceae bacterium]